MAFCSRCGVSIEGRYCSACGYDNQPQEKTQSVDDTINQLYSLRAGISLVTVQIEDTKKAEEKGKKNIEDKENQIKLLKESAKSKQSSIASKKEKINVDTESISTLQKKIISNNLQELERKKQETEAKEEKRKKKEQNKVVYIFRQFVAPFIAIIGALLAIAGALALVADLLCFIVGLVVHIFGGQLAPENVEDALLIWQLVGGIGGIVVGGVIFFIAGLLTSPDFKSELAKLDEKIKEENKAIQEMVVASENCEKEIVQLEKEIVQLKEDADKLDKEASLGVDALSKFKKDHTAEIEYYKLCTNETYNLLVKEYSTLLDVRDWDDLDLVIYYLETRRAISVREALQLADRQHQTDAIIGAFKSATAQISETIRMSADRLEGTMLKCSKVISAQLEDVSGRLNSIEVGQDIMNNHLKNISSEMAVSNALQAKANVSSERMMQDIRQMRIYADNSAIKARNG